MKSCRYSNMARMTNGDLYAWGSNDQEQFSFKDYMGFTLSETIKMPMPCSMEQFEGALPIQHEVSDFLSVVLCGIPKFVFYHFRQRKSVLVWKEASGCLYRA